MSASAPSPDLAHIDTWVFDLDNTLYHPKHELFTQIDAKMGAFIANMFGCDLVEARRIQKEYFHAHGTTLAGLMKDHDVKPDVFLDFVHDVVLDTLEPEPGLREALTALPGRHLIFTNADVTYAGRVLDKLGIADLFDGMFDIHAAHYVPKPADAPYAALVETFAINPASAIFFEDMARNLIPAHRLGFTTVWIDNGSESGDRDSDPAYIDYHIDDLVPFLQGITRHHPTKESRVP